VATANEGIFFLAPVAWQGRRRDRGPDPSVVAELNAGRVRRHRLDRARMVLCINCCPRDGTPVTASSASYFQESQSFWFWSLEDQIPHVRKVLAGELRGGGMPREARSFDAPTLIDRYYWDWRNARLWRPPGST
jgi:hypothetical protein